MKKIKLFTAIIISIQLFIFIVLWFLSYDNVYKLAHTINSIFVLITGVLMIKYIIKINKKVISEESIFKTLLNLSLDGIYIENDFSVTFSAGLFEVPHKNIDEHSSEKTIKLIDDLMYKAKEYGKNCIITPSNQNS